MKKVHGFERVALMALALVLAPAPLWAAEGKAGADKPPAAATQAAAKAQTTAKASTRAPPATGARTSAKMLANQRAVTGNAMI